MFHHCKFWNYGSFLRSLYFFKQVLLRLKNSTQGILVMCYILKENDKQDIVQIPAKKIKSSKCDTESLENLFYQIFKNLFDN